MATNLFGSDPGTLVRIKASNTSLVPIALLPPLHQHQSTKSKFEVVPVTFSYSLLQTENMANLRFITTNLVCATVEKEGGGLESC
jgi:hypothetical protein